MLNMDNSSKTLPSITAVNSNSMLLQQNLPSSNENFDDDDDNNDSLTNVSVIIQTKSSPINNDQTSKYSQPIIPTNDLSHNQVLQSLMAYANSFHLDETIYSIHDFKNQFDSIKQTSTKQRTSSIKNHQLNRSHFVSSNKTEDDHSDKNTTVTDGSKFQWEYSSAAIDHSNKPYTTKTNFQNLKNLSSPIIVYEKTKDRFLPQNVDIQVLRSPTPIIVREVLPKPAPTNRFISKNHLPPSSNAPSQRHPLSKPPIIPKRKINDHRISPKQSKKIVIEYDQINVTVDKNIIQRKEIRRVNPNEYVQQYGSSLYSKEVFQHLFTNLLS